MNEEELIQELQPPPPQREIMDGEKFARLLPDGALAYTARVGTEWVVVPAGMLRRLGLYRPDRS